VTTVRAEPAHPITDIAAGAAIAFGIAAAIILGLVAAAFAWPYVKAAIRGTAATLARSGGALITRRRPDWDAIYRLEEQTGMVNTPTGDLFVHAGAPRRPAVQRARPLPKVPAGPAPGEAPVPSTGHLPHVVPEGHAPGEPAPARHACTDTDAAHTCPEPPAPCAHTCPVALPTSHDRPGTCRHCGEPIEYVEITSLGDSPRYLPQIHTCDPEQRALVDRWNAATAGPLLVLPPGGDMHYLSAENYDRVRIQMADRFARARAEQEHNR
jgi:hypothetical protein